MTDALQAMEQLIESLGSEAGARAAQSGDERDYANGDRVLAVVSRGAVELRLGPEIAEAARRTPDTDGSARGPDWVRFAPAEWDDHASDRLEAWFRVAWRLAGDRR